MVYVSVPVMMLPVPTRLALLIRLSSTDAGLFRGVRVERLEIVEVVMGVVSGVAGGGVSSGVKRGDASVSEYSVDELDELSTAALEAL